MASLMSGILAGAESVFPCVVVLKRSCEFFDTPPIKVSDLCSFLYVSLLDGGGSDIL